jgi:hypothetical protein
MQQLLMVLGDNEDLASYTPALVEESKEWATIDIIFDKKMTWRLQIETVATKACRTFIRSYSLFKSVRLSTTVN